MKPVEIAARWLGVETGEARIFFWGATTCFLIGWGSVSLTNVSETLFLKRVGVELLPVVFLCSSLLLVLTTSVVARLVARARLLSLLRRTFLLLAASLIPLWFLQSVDPRTSFALVLAAKQFESILLGIFWATLGSELHARQAKRLYAPIVAGGTLGELLGSFASAPVGHTLGVSSLIPVAALAFAAAAAASLLPGARAPVRLAPARAQPSSPGARSVRLLWGESWLFRLLVMSAVFGGALGPMLYFEFSYVSDLATQGSNGEQHLLRLFAHFRGYLSVAVLVLQLSGTSWIFRRIGVPLASSLSPLVYVSAFLALCVHVGLPVVLGAVAAVNLQDHALHDPAQKILATLFPERVRPAATVLIEGPMRRLGGTLGCLAVLAVLAFGPPAGVAYLGLPIAAAWLVICLALWRVYPTLLLEVATARRRPRTEEPGQLAPPLGRGMLRVLAEALSGAERHRCRAACTLIVHAPPRRAVAVLASSLGRAPAANLPLLIQTLIEVIIAAGGRMRAPAAAAQIEGLLRAARPLGDVERARLLRAYVRLLPGLRPGSAAARMVALFSDDPAACVRLAAAACLHEAGVAPATAPGVDSLLSAALLSDQADVREIALEELHVSCLFNGKESSFGPVWEFRIAQLAALLEAPDTRARAAEVLADVAAHHGLRVAQIGEVLVAHAQDPDPRVRAAVLRFVGHARLEKHLAWVVGRLGADDEDEAAAAHEALRCAGMAALNVLLEALHFGRRGVRLAVMPILNDIHVDAATLRTLIDREIGAVRRMLVRMHGLSRGPVADLVLQRLAERVEEGIHTTLHLLAALEHDDRYAAIARQLIRFRSGSARAVLVEALEALLPPEERERLMPLIEEPSPLHRAPAAAAALGCELPTFEEAMRETLADTDPLTVDFLSIPVGATAADAVGLASGAHLGNDGDPGEREAVMLSRAEIVLHLRGHPLFGSLSTRELYELSRVVREEVHQAGSSILREGALGDCMYLILSGEVCVTRGDQVIARRGPGELFGEVAIFHGESRSATVTATSRVHLLAIERRSLFELIEEQPSIALGLCQTLSLRVREMIERLGGQ